MHRAALAGPGQPDDVLDDVDDGERVPTHRVAPARWRLRLPEAGQVERPSVEADGEQGGEVGPVGGGAAEAVDVDRALPRSPAPCTVVRTAVRTAVRRVDRAGPRRGAHEHLSPAHRYEPTR